MRNVWKGMVLGALTGAAAGFGIDLAEGGADRVSRTAGKARDAVSEKLPAAVDVTKSTARKAQDFVADKGPDIIEAGRHSAATARDAAAGWVDEHTP